MQVYDKSKSVNFHDDIWLWADELIVFCIAVMKDTIPYIYRTRALIQYKDGLPV